MLNGLVACTIFVGMALATGIGSVIPESFAGYMFAIAAGVMLHVVAFDVVPHVRKKTAHSH
jgi:zinc transporter ZupT